jgi:Fe2+ or Zn2+ uptake regulation protein
MDAETIRQLLDANGVKFTTQRYCVMAFLMQTAGHPTATEIFDGVNRLDPRSARATVYRNLRDLVDAGLVREVAVEGRAARFDVRGMRHHHFICDRCGEVEDMEWFNVPQPSAEFMGKRMVRECEVILRGLCTGCAPSPRESSKAVARSSPASARSSRATG